MKTNRCNRIFSSWLSALVTVFTCVAVPANASPVVDAKYVDVAETQLLVLLNTKTADRIANSVEEVVQAASALQSTAAERVILFSLGAPKVARYLIAERLSSAVLDRMGRDSARALLQDYVVLTYADRNEAAAVSERLTLNKGVTHVSKNRRFSFSATPNDPSYANGSGYMNYQWGMQSMNFPGAWDTVHGNAYVAVLDIGINQSHPDLAENFKPQLSGIVSSAPTLEDGYFNGMATYQGHGTHVAGIIGASTNNSTGVAGGCWHCSLMIVKLIDDVTYLGGFDRVAAGIVFAVDSGAQVINMSFGSYSSRNCVGSNDSMCLAIQHAVNRGVVMVAAAGNNAAFRRNDSSEPDSGDVQEPANQPAIIPVGATQPTSGSRGFLWTETRVSDELFSGSAAGPTMAARGITAPGMDIFSTFPYNANWNAGTFCADIVVGSTPIDGFGPCTGTSMATPHISALVGLMRSVNPWESPDNIRSYLQAAGDNAGAPNTFVGYGQPNAATAVASVLGTTNRLVPLLSMYSSGSENYFYTTVPQMAIAAYVGTLKPGFAQAYTFVGTTPSPYSWISLYPGTYFGATTGAEAWIFSTHINPANPNVELSPLYRLSWKCGDSYSPRCGVNPSHADHAYVANQTDVAAYIGVGYKLDGIEGYIYPIDQTQPSGTVRLILAYHPTLDDHAVYPELLASIYDAQGYSYIVKALGYVYKNSGLRPTY